MLTTVTIRNLKRLREARVDLADSVILAGPNNFGKTTTLQALSIWYLACKRWIEARELRSSKAKERTGVPIARKDFTAVPVRSLDLLWTGRSVGRRRDKAKPPLIQIIVEGSEGTEPWRWGMELQYQSSELLYCRAMEPGAVPDPVRRLTVVHVPPLGGVQTDEEKREPGIQDRLIGEGRPGEILRNLLLQVHETRPDQWDELVKAMREMFQITLLPPSFSGTYISCEYVPTRPPGGHKAKSLDVANAGSGFHQVLLLLAFFYARPGAVLLLDEPDAHLHVILQRDVYALVRRVASDRASQLVISTHSEVILDETDPSGIVAFTGERPHRLVNTSQKAQLRKALTKLHSLDFVLADQVGGVLYCEGDTDASILREWARVLDHPAYEFLKEPFMHPIGGNDISEARDHFFALREAYPGLKGACVLDRLQKPVPADWSQPAMFAWSRREIENYLLHPGALRRFVVAKAPLGEVAGGLVDRAFARQVRSGFDPFDDGIVFLREVKASDDFLLPLMGECGLSTSKKDLFLLAGRMTPDEIHPEVRRALDHVALLVRPPVNPETPVGGPAEDEGNGPSGQAEPIRPSAHPATPPRRSRPRAASPPAAPGAGPRGRAVPPRARRGPGTSTAPG
jgi:ABC-type branched-subunit amino acid transport system ATPase component